MNFGIIGVGSFGIKRAKAIQNSTGSLSKIYDVNKENLKKASEELKIDPTNNLNDIFDDEKIKAICICAPNKFHKELIIKGIKAGKHVFCEKPIATSVAEGQEILSACKNSKVKVQIGSNHRYFESIKFAKKLLDNKEIGDVISFSGRIGHNGERIKNSWFWKKEISGGGTLIDNGCHLLDLSRYFMGNFASGTGLISNIYWKDMNVEDTAIGSFRTKDGKTSSIFSSWRLLSGYFFIELNGTDGYINIDARFDTHGGDKIFWKIKNEDIQSKDFSKIKPNSYVEEINAFIEKINNGQECSPSISDGIEVLKMVNFIYSEK